MYLRKHGLDGGSEAPRNPLGIPDQVLPAGRGHSRALSLRPPLTQSPMGPQLASRTGHSSRSHFNSFGTSSKVTRFQKQFSGSAQIILILEHVFSRGDRKHPENSLGSSPGRPQPQRMHVNPLHDPAPGALDKRLDPDTRAWVIPKVSGHVLKFCSFKSFLQS